MTIGQNAQRLPWHDAVLLKVDIDQELGTSSVNIRPFGTAKVTIALGRGIQVVNYSRAAPWGPSDFINSATLMPRHGANLATLEIEMQSGDIVTITAEEFWVHEES